MKKSLLLLALAASLAFSAAAPAQTLSLNYSPRTGDVWLDARLGEINTYGRGNPDYFYDDLYSNYGAPRDYVRELYEVRRWAPGDIYYACALAQLLDRPCREIVSDYDRHPGQGWGALAQRMGIKPGSAEFHALKGRVDKGHGRLKSHGHGGRHDDGHDDSPGGKPNSQGNPGKGNSGKGNSGKGGQDKGKGKGKG
jgi:hypothetical protein